MLGLREAYEVVPFFLAPALRRASLRRPATRVATIGRDLESLQAELDLERCRA